MTDLKPRMNFSGANLELIADALEHALDGIHGHIGSCPDVYEYADDLAQLEMKAARYRKLRDRVCAKIGRETEND